MENQVSKIDLQIFLILDNATVISAFNLSSIQHPIRATARLA